MKKFILALLSLATLFCLCACGSKDKKKAEEPVSPLDNIISGDTQGIQNNETVSPEPTPVVLPQIDPNDDFLRGTWIDISGQSVSDTLDHYYGTDKNYMTLSPDGTGSLVLGGSYRDLFWSNDGGSLSISFPASGESCSGSIINNIIYELQYVANGRDVTLTFIKIENQDVKN